jgi:hypothetical protein
MACAKTWHSAADAEAAAAVAEVATIAAAVAVLATDVDSVANMASLDLTFTMAAIFRGGGGGGHDGV